MRKIVRTYLNKCTMRLQEAKSKTSDGRLGPHEEEDEVDSDNEDAAAESIVLKAVSGEDDQVRACRVPPNGHDNQTC
jgi:hypothetical protein